MTGWVNLPDIGTCATRSRRRYSLFASFAIVFLWVALATFADICFTTATRFMSADFLVGLLCYALTAFLALIAFHRQQWGWIIIVWSCFSFVLAMLLSVVLFREPFTAKRALASAFVLLGILLND